MHKLFLALGLCAALVGCSSSIPRIPVHADLAEHTVCTTVDSDLAKYYLEQYLAGKHTDPIADAEIAAVENRIFSGGGTSAYLAEVTELYSADFVALVLWQHIQRQPDNLRAQRVYRSEVRKLLAASFGGEVGELAHQQDYLFVFLPGWMYEWRPESGGDFAEPRRVIREAGMRTLLLETDENGTIENNAEFICNELKQILPHEENVILVSVSKAGAEAALALTMLNEEGNAANIKAWLNIGGVLRGTPLADLALEWPMSWAIKMFVLTGGSLDGLRSMTPAIAGARADRYSIPSDLVVLNFIGIPMSGQVTRLARPGFSRLRQVGPNDGATLILDEILPGSHSITELGLDHFFLDPKVDLKTLALARSLIRLVEENGE